MHIMFSAQSSKAMANAIRSCFETIVENVDTDDIILKLYQERALTQDDYEIVNDVTGGQRKVSIFLVST